MKAGGGSPKGGERERGVCKRLSLWVSNGASTDLFWRSAMSGGRATVQLKSGRVNVRQSGDICAIDPLGYPFVEANFTEVKHYKDLNIARGFVCQTGVLISFWRHARREAAKYGKRPLLVAQQNRYPTLAITDWGAGIFEGDPVIELYRWEAWVYLFDEVTRVRTRLMRRRAS
jgi:hypothetical protein